MTIWKRDIEPRPDHHHHAEHYPTGVAPQAATYLHHQTEIILDGRCDTGW